MKRYFQEFSDIESVRSNFGIDDTMVSDREILFAYYGYESYCGSATVLFKRNGKLYEVAGSHCSCRGLEGQWNPSEVTWDQLAMRRNFLGSGYDDNRGEAETQLLKLIRRHAPRG